MNLVLFITSYIFLNIIGSLTYIGLLLLLFTTLKKTFNMNEHKWDTLFNYQKGKGLYYTMAFPYLLMLVIIFPLSIFWFNLINFKYELLGSIAVIILLTLTIVFKLPKLKDGLNAKYS